MKTAVAIMTVIVVFACIQYHVESTSPMNCRGCNRRWCPQVNCSCGGYMDECNCCARCYKCRMQTCSRIAMERCQPGSTCRPPRDAVGIQAYNLPGQCL